MTYQAKDWLTGVPGVVPLSVCAEPAPERSPGGLLGRFRFAPWQAVQAGDLEIDLPYLGGDRVGEDWQGRGEVVQGGEKGVFWSATDNLLLASLELPCDGLSDPAEVSRVAYQRLMDRVRDLGYPWLLRSWNFLPQINLGEGDSERYRRFCWGRSLGLEDRDVREAELCAATAVGTQGERLLVHLLAGTAPGMPVENPRQVAAYHYPRIYGRRSPSFARAMAVTQEGNRYALLISGTASIVGHRTVYPGETLPQLGETIQNLEALVGEAKSRLGSSSPGAFGAGSLLRVYVRHGYLWDAIARRLRAAWPNASLVGLEADICRRDLMVEIEAFHPL